VHSFKKALNLDLAGNGFSESGSNFFDANCRGVDSVDSSISDLGYLVPIIPVPIDFGRRYDVISEVFQKLVEVDGCICYRLV
jgi:hypothetical protein